MIRLAKILEIPEILRLTNACMLDLRSREIFQWTEDYPSQEAFKEDIKNNGLYVYEADQILGVIALCDDMDKVYKNVSWLTPNVHNLYVHRLAVHPEFQKQGIGSALMDFAEDRARQDKYKSVRLDTFSQNPGNQRFYENRGYIKLEEVFFPKQSKHPFYCYELVI